jgi:energy-coupling factor transporter ATP-binding protein EcfA2
VTLLRFLAAAPGEAVDRDVLLREVWGYAPNVQSRAIDKTVHRLRTKLEIDPAEPWHLQGVRGLGYRLTGITLQEPDAPATNLRPSLAPAFGLGPTLVRLRERLTAPGTVVSLVGPPGSGKSRLATELGVLLGDDGWTCWLIPGGGCATAEALARAVCDELHTPWGGTVSAREAARRALARSGPVLVVVDDVGAVEPSLLLDGLLGATRWLLLARTAADTNDALTVRTSPLSPADGAALLLDRARRAGIDVAASPELEDIVIAVGGHAQTLELLAPRLAFFDAPALLASARAGVTGRGEARWARALELAVDSQWGALSSEEAGILARCAALTPPFSLAAALAVQPELDPERVVDALETAERRGVLVRADGGERRFSLPGPLRTRGLRHLAATGEEGRVTRLAEEHRVHEAEAFERDVREGRAARGFQGLERLRADLWSTVERWTQADPMFALRAAIPLALVQIRRGPPRYVALLNPLLDRPEVVPLRSRGRIVRAGAARRAGDLDSARAEARALADDPDPTVRAEAVVLLAGTAGAVGVPWAETIRLLEAALAAVDESSEPRVAVRLRVSIAIQRSWEGRLEESLFLFQAAEAW